MTRLEQILTEAYVKIKANQDSSHEAIDPVIIEAMQKYATEVARHNLERAAEKVDAGCELAVMNTEIELI